MKELATQQSNFGMTKDVVLTHEQMDLLSTQICKGLTVDELKLFIYKCVHVYGVHPLSGNIYAIKRKGRQDDPDGSEKITFQAGIDYFYKRAHATGRFNGVSVEEGPMMGSGFPEWVLAKVFIKDVDYPIEAKAYWKEYYPGERLGHMWRRMPVRMLTKCAEALALRRAFPGELHEIWEFAEMEQAAAPADSQITYTETVKTRKSEPSKTAAAGKTVNDTLQAELTAYCEATGKDYTSVLKEISKFKTDKGEEKWASDVSKMTNRWAGTSLSNLRELPTPESKEQESEQGSIKHIPAGCTENPETCPEASFVQERAGAPLVTYCSSGVICLYHTNK